MSGAIQKRQTLTEQLTTTGMAGQGFGIANLMQAAKLSEILAAGNFVPAAYKNKPGDVLAALMLGHEVGLAPMAALRYIAVINGNPRIWGDGLWALVVGHPEYLPHSQTVDKATKTAIVTCRRMRNGHKVENTYTFSMQDAQQGGLLGKQTYKQWPKDMILRRAKWRAAHDMYPDAISGIRPADEYGDGVVVDAAEPLRSGSVLEAKAEAEAQVADQSWGFEAQPDDSAPAEDETAQLADDDDEAAREAKAAEEAEADAAWERAEAAAKAARR